MGGQHTPGPWRYYDERPNMAASIVAFGKTVAHIYLTKGDEGEDAQNARLIAAAPELLEALLAEVEAQRLTDEHVEMIEYHAAHGMDDATGSSHCFSAARRADEAWAKAHTLRDAAIAKATGAPA